MPKTLDSTKYVLGRFSNQEYDKKGLKKYYKSKVIDKLIKEGTEKFDTSHLVGESVAIKKIATTYSGSELTGATIEDSLGNKIVATVEKEIDTILMAVGSNAILVSTDNGKTWVNKWETFKALYGSTRTPKKVIVVDDYFYIYTEGSVDFYIYKTQDGISYESFSGSVLLYDGYRNFFYTTNTKEGEGYFVIVETDLSSNTSTIRAVSMSEYDTWVMISFSSSFPGFITYMDSNCLAGYISVSKLYAFAAYTNMNLSKGDIDINPLVTDISESPLRACYHNQSDYLISTYTRTKLIYNSINYTVEGRSLSLFLNLNILYADDIKLNSGDEVPTPGFILIGSTSDKTSSKQMAYFYKGKDTSLYDWGDLSSDIESTLICDGMKLNDYYYLLLGDKEMLLASKEIWRGTGLQILYTMPTDLDVISIAKRSI